MTLLKDYNNDNVFYYGTIFIIKDFRVTPNGLYDAKFCIVRDSLSVDLRVLDLDRSIGSIGIMDIKPNVEGHCGVDKNGIYKWVDDYIRLFYNEDYYNELKDKLEDLIHIDYLDNYFKQTNKDIFI